MQEPVAVDVQIMKTSAGTDYYVRIRCGGRETTPYIFKERYKAAYSADHFAWIFGLRPDDPDLMAYGPDTYSNETRPHPDRGCISARYDD